MEECLKLAVKVLNKTMDSTTPSPEKMEFTTITRVNGKVTKTVFGFFLSGSGWSVGFVFLSSSVARSHRFVQIVRKIHHSWNQPFFCCLFLLFPLCF